MKKDLKRNLLVLMVLFLITGITIGFAVYQRTLTISSSATVTPSGDNFNLQISSSATEVVTNSVIPVKYDETATATIDATDAILSNSGGIMTIRNINASLQAEFSLDELNYPKVAYTFYIHNTGEYDAYLSEVDFGDIICTAKSGTTQSSVDDTCDNMDIVVTVYTDLNSNDNFNNYFSPSIGRGSAVAGKSLTPGSVWKVIVELGFGIISPYNGYISDGPFDVNYGDVNLIFSSQQSDEIVVN